MRDASNQLRTPGEQRRAHRAAHVNMFSITGIRLGLLAGWLLAAVALPGQRGALNLENADIIASAQGVSLSSKAATVELRRAPGSESLATRIENLRDDHHILLVLREVGSEEPPGVIFAIYLDLSSGAETETAEGHFVGYLNFFGLANGAKPGTRSFDITDLVRDLKKRNQLTQATTLTMRSDTAPAAGSKARIGKLDIVENPS